MSRALNYIICLILTACLPGLQSHATARADDAYMEVVYLHLDKEVYLSGEQIRFKAYVLDGSSGRLSELSKVVYVELLNLQNRPVVSVKISVTGGTGEGYLPLPGSLLSENYSVRAYTRWMQNFDPGLFFTRRVIVVNPFVPVEVPEDSSTDMIAGGILSDKTTMPLNGRIKTDKTRYTSREKCIIRINTVNLNGDPVPADLSVSVRSQDYCSLLPGCSLDGYLERIREKMDQPRDGQVVWTIPADNRGLALHGRVLNFDNPSGSAGRVFISRIDSMPDVYVADILADGKFYINLREQYGDYSWVLKAEDERYNSGIRISDGFSGYIGKDSLPPLVFYSGLRELVEKQMVNFQISRQFAPSGKLPGMTDLGALPFYGKPDETILIDEYIKLPVTEELFTELVRSVLLEVQRGRYILKILNPVDNQILPGNPLVLLDGVPLFDPDLLMAIDPRRLLRIDVVASRYVVGDQSFGGIISVRTRRGDHSEIPFGSARQVGFKAFQPVKPCIRPDYETADRIHDRIPDFRTVLYWDPVVRTDGSGQAVVEFYTSDESDSYTITVQGITESGDPVHLEQVIEVTGK